MNLPGRTTILRLSGGRDLWRALDTVALSLPEQMSGSWTATDQSGADLDIIPVFPGSYIRHGRLVLAPVGVRWPITTDLRTARLGGLPVTCDGRNNHAVVIYVTTCGIPMTGVVLAGTTTMQWFKLDGSTVTNADLSGAHLGVTAVYFTA